MNLIVNGRLDQNQKQVIYELTLKKQRSKKRTMSEKQLRARQQLARELIRERKDPLDLHSYPQLNNHHHQQQQQRQNPHHNHQYHFHPALDFCHNFSSLNLDEHSSELGPNEGANNTNPLDSTSNSTASAPTVLTTSEQPSAAAAATVANTSTAHMADCPSSLDRQLSTGSIGTSTSSASSSSTQSIVARRLPMSSIITCGCSFSRSDISYTGSSTSDDSGTQMIAVNESLVSSDASHSHPHSNSHSQAKQADQQHQAQASQPEEQTDELARKKEANIKYNKLRLGQLNAELERRLHQYEYLVVQEKALLGAYNMMLFTNKGVNNFHLSSR